MAGQRRCRSCRLRRLHDRGVGRQRRLDEVELGRGAQIRKREIRDLSAKNLIVPTTETYIFSDPGQCKNHFTPERWEELKRKRGNDLAWGLEAHLIDPDEVQRLVLFDSLPRMDELPAEVDGLTTDPEAWLHKQGLLND